MAEWASLFLVACALYLAECVTWFGSDSWGCVRHPMRGRWRAVKGAWLPGNDRGGLALADPLHTSGGVIVCGRWPLSMSPEGIANVAPDAESAGEQPLFHAFDDIDAVAVELDAVLINGRRFFKAGSSAEALHLAACVDRVRERPAARRGAAIERMVADALDSGKAETARANFARRTRLLTRCCAALFAFVFIASPSLLIFAGPHRSWPWLLGGLVALTATVTVLYVRAHAEMFPRCRYDRWVHAVTMVLLPVGAIRAVDHLLRDVFCACSPPAVLPIVCGDADAEPSMRKYLFDIGKGRAIDAGEPPAPAVACVEWFRRTLVAASESALLRRGLAVLRPPVREADTLRAYCPRCHAQYGSAAVGRCSECPGVALVAF